MVRAARDLMGQALAIEGKLDQAAEQFTLLTQDTPRDPAPFVRLGNIRLRQRRFDEGIAQLPVGAQAAARTTPRS